MKILYVTYEFIDCENLQVIDGGLANYLHKIATTLHTLGHDVIVLVYPSSCTKTISYKGVTVVFLSDKFQKTLLHRLIWPFISSRTKRKIKGFHTILSTYIKKLDKAHKLDIIQYASDLNLGQYLQKEIPSCLRISSYAKTYQECYDIHNPEALKMWQEIIISTPYLFGPSKHIADLIKRDLCLDKDIKIIESPYPQNIDKQDSFDNSIFDDLQLKIKNNPYLLFFGTIGRLKGCGVIADCIYDILAKYPHLYLVLVGKNPIFNDTDYLQMIKDKAKEFANRIIRYSSIPHTQLYPIIKNAIGVLMPSLTENFSNACVEAMRLRKIVIGTEANFSQLLTDRVSGFLAKIGDSQSLKEKIIELISLTPKQKEKMEQKAFERTESLSPENICNQLLDYYRYVIKHWEVKNG